MSEPHDETLQPTLRPSGNGSTAVEGTVEQLGLPHASRYVEVRLLGRGGMGEVRLVRDLSLEREVALKQMRAALDDGADVRRFLRELKVQGQLDHPSVVPVYEAGLSPDGAPWFTMKRVRGQTLAEVIDLLAEGDEATRARYTRRRLLSIFVTICECVESAHARGVLHRDLKPGNVMLGEFGEVHVLDWGLARVRGATDELTARAPEARVEGGTEVGLVMGTPGYMSPEQAEGRHDELDERADVYALGAILFEVLALAPLSEATTRKLPSRDLTRAARGTPRDDVPPELDAIWRKACSAEPSLRHRTARELADAVERFLEGQRDEERRRELAAAQVQVAEAQPLDTHEGRRAALRALGRALALEPGNARALARLAALLATPPAETPPGAVAELEALRRARARGTAGSTAIRLGTWLLGLALAAPLLGVKSAPLVALVLGALGAGAGACWLVWRRADAEALTPVVALVGVACVGLLALTLHPLVVVPTLAATHAMLLAASSSVRVRGLTIGASLVAGALPLLRMSEYLTVQGGALVLASPMFSLDAAAAPAFLLAFSLVPLVTPALLLGRLRDAAQAAERATIVQAAALRDLVPEP